VPAGGGLVALVNGVPAVVQLDVKTRYEDGSVKMAVLSVERPALLAGQSVAVELVAGPAPAGPVVNLATALAGLTLARNEAPGLQANTVQALGEPADGTQRFAAWRCPG